MSRLVLRRVAVACGHRGDGRRRGAGRPARVRAACSASFPQSVTYTLGVLAPFITRDLGIGAAAFGLLSTVLFVVAAVASPWAGGLVDRFGGHRMLLALFASTGAAWVVMAGLTKRSVTSATGPPVGDASRHGAPRHRSRVTWLMIYAFLTNISATATIVYLPLYAYTHLDWSEGLAGSITAVGGVTSMVGRFL